MSEGNFTTDDAETDFPVSYSTTSDRIISSFIVLIFLAGSFLNILTSLYFGIVLHNHMTKGGGTQSRRGAKKVLYNGLYFLNALNDLLICGSVLPVAASYWQHRTRAWVSSAALCAAWGVLWEILPFVSIMFVLALSSTRTYHLIFPLGAISIPLVGALIGLYTAFCVGRSLVPLFTSYGVYTFHSDSSFCFEWAREKYPGYKRFAEYSDALQIAFPLLPILASCIISSSKVFKRRYKSKSRRNNLTQVRDYTICKLIAQKNKIITSYMDAKAGRMGVCIPGPHFSNYLQN